MINLLPTAVKSQVAYAKNNRLLLRYLRLTVVVLLMLAAIFVTSIIYINQQASQLANQTKDREKDIATLAPDIAKARAAAERLLAIKTIHDSQTKFSRVVSELTNLLPGGVTMDTISLTGDATKPLQLSIKSQSYNAVLAFREALAKSSIISGVDLENIQQNSATDVSASLVVGFKPGFANQPETKP